MTRPDRDGGVARVHASALAGLCAASFVVCVHSAGADVVRLTASADATLYESLTGSLGNGAGQYLHVGRTNQAPSGQSRRSLIRFDLAGGLPSGADITSVRLILNLSQFNGDSSEVRLHRALAPWTTGASDPTGGEGSGAPALTGDATWLHSSFNGAGGGLLWSQAGGDFASAASASVTSTGLGLHIWSSPALVADARLFASTPSLNHGWFMLGAESTMGVTRRFDSADSAGAGGIVPILEIEYSVVPAPGALTLCAVGAWIGMGTRRRRKEP